MAAQFEPDKFFVVKAETLQKLCAADSKFYAAIVAVIGALEVERGLGVHRNRYIVCNQDEPYAERVLQVILEGEDAKAEATSTSKE